MVLVCRFAIPCSRFRVILRHAYANVIAFCKGALGFWQTLIRSLAIPKHSFLVILRYAFPIIITKSKHNLA